MEYLTKWEEAQPMKDFTRVTSTNFLFEYVLTRFGCPKVLMSDWGTHFLNEMINAPTKVFQVYHQKSILYHPGTNRIVKAFNKILENALKYIFNTQRNEWAVHVPAVLWAYKTTVKKITC